ncbi:kinase-like domain-containing protein [Ampelomyces quisqualis]|uniref:EKC/KEOPS complex subunit BUD32 n=1 Tax=Ampelomyces quisqualis TaxID=50730 RepID=A0A6A5QSX8_AMPQU|nr:kinase-like domain-containing protein [Ampelomyces quisqualis]
MTQSTHTLPPPFLPSTCTPITQGAEALVYKTCFLTPCTPAILKFRPRKPYRHPTLDQRLTKARLLAEARSLVRCKKEGVSVPGVLGVDAEHGWIVLEYVPGPSIRVVLDWWAGAQRGGGGEAEAEAEAEAMGRLMGRVGREVGRLHAVGVCHGDLTTSNLMLRCAGFSPVQTTAMELGGEVVLIDFGLTTASIQDEDKAVDLYVLERAFAATHPAAEPLFQEVLRGREGV